MTLSKVKDLSLILLFVMMSYAVWDITRVVRQTSEDLRSEVRTTNVLLQREMVMWRTNGFQVIDSRLTSLEKNTMSRLDRLNFNLNSNLVQFNQNAAVLANNTTTVANEFQKTAVDFRVLQADVTKRVRLFDSQLDCSVNDFCWQNLATDTMIASRDMSLSGSKAFFEVSSNVPVWTQDFNRVSGALSVGIPKVTDNVADITLNVKRMTTKRWYDRIIGIAAGTAIGMAGYK